MASEQHLEFSDFIKAVHKSLRVEAKKLGDPDLAWQKHLEKVDVLEKYAESMQTLSEKYWENNKDTSQNRISWTTTSCLNYFNTELMNHRLKEERILQKDFIENVVQLHRPIACYRRQQISDSKLRLLDVGSCFNPFEKFTEFDVTAIDIAPSKHSGVYQTDFLTVRINDTDSKFQICHNRLTNLPRNYFDCVVFSLLLEYLPTSEQRLICIGKAYEVLDNEGILVIITPDSKHVGANAKLMKNWRYTLALHGFNRIKFEKLEHVTCMVFRKAIHPIVTKRWARIHKEAYMIDELNIPQDFNKPENELAQDLEVYRQLKEAVSDVNFLHELPDMPED